MRYLGLILFLSLLTSCGVAPLKNNQFLCIKKRGSIDIGSGSTKFLLAKINVCEKKLLSIMNEKRVPIKFKESLHQNNGLLTEKNYQTIVKELSQMIAPYRGDKSFDFRAVATEVFRQAKNGHTFIKRLNARFPFPIKLIDQRKEAELGFWGAQSHPDLNAKDIVVWDIGGGSMQFATMRKGHIFTSLSKLASVSFKNKVLKKQGRHRGSPNPIGPFTKDWAVHYSRDHANKAITSIIKEELAKKRVIGIGGVHFFSIREQLSLPVGRPYSAFQVKKALNDRSLWSDIRLQGQYRETEVTNLALVLGHMKALNIQTVLPINVNLSTGILFDESLW